MSYPVRPVNFERILRVLAVFASLPFSPRTRAGQGGGSTRPGAHPTRFKGVGCAQRSNAEFKQEPAEISMFVAAKAMSLHCFRQCFEALKEDLFEHLLFQAL